MGAREAVEGGGTGAERDIKKMQAEVENLRNEADATGRSAENEQASKETLRTTNGDAMRCTHVCVYPFFQP